MKFVQWIIDLFKDERGNPSVKPVIAVYGSVSLILCLFINGFYNTFAPSETLVDALLFIIIVGMGSDTLDKFSFKNFKSTKQQESSHIEEQPKEKTDEI
jgi:hypothetical protein